MSVADSPLNPMLKKYLLKDLQAAAGISDVAEILGFKHQSVAYILYGMPEAAKYNSFVVPKRSGGTRTISAPTAELKLLQQRLSAFMQDCLEEIDKKSGGRKSVSHGFERKRSILTNAKRHRNHRFVFNIDLADFFGSIHLGRIRGLLMKDKNFALNSKTATILAQIACFNNGLPQGSPCSPVFANIVARVMDSHLTRLAASNKCTYSRYADDVTFSTNLKNFPAAIAVRTGDEAHSWEPGVDLKNVISQSGFRINDSKSRMQYCDSRQEVTGLIVNAKVNVKSEYRRTVRTQVHKLLSTGSFTHDVMTVDATGVSTKQETPGKIGQLHGKLGFINRVDSYNRTQPDKAVKDIKEKAITGELMYRRFLLYKWFYTTDMPTIVCEGITDNVYLLHAIRSLAANFPELATIEADGKKKLNVRFFRYPGREDKQTSSTGRILGLTGGGTCLAQLIPKYRDEIARYHPLVNKQPVILLLDNDSGADPVYSTIKEVTGMKANRDDDFTHVMSNMYVVSTKRIDKKPSKIEDFFEAADKNRELAGRTFSDAKEPDPVTHYGKVEFATKIVRPNADTMNFDGFTDLLTTLVAVIKHRSAAV